MLSKVLNNYIRNLAHANVFPDTNDMHANKYVTHACDVAKAVRLFDFHGDTVASENPVQIDSPGLRRIRT